VPLALGSPGLGIVLIATAFLTGGMSIRAWLADHAPSPRRGPRPVETEWNPIDLANAIQEHGDDRLTQFLHEQSRGAPGERPLEISDREWHGSAQHQRETLDRYYREHRTEMLRLLREAEEKDLADEPHLTLARAPKTVDDLWALVNRNAKLVKRLRSL
jgi:hypothetical protein